MVRAHKTFHRLAQRATRAPAQPRPEHPVLQVVRAVGEGKTMFRGNPLLADGFQIARFDKREIGALGNFLQRIPEVGKAGRFGVVQSSNLETDFFHGGNLAAFFQGLLEFCFE